MNSNDELSPKLTVEKAKGLVIEKLSLDEKQFRYDLNKDAMAT